jgi:hypothetical protein
MSRGDGDFHSGDHKTVFARFFQSATRAKADSLHFVASALLQKCTEDPRAAIEFLKRRDQRNWEPPKLDQVAYAREQADRANADGDIEAEADILRSRLAMLEAQRGLAAKRMSDE